MLDIIDLQSGYGKVTVLRDLAFSIQPLETVAIIGPNGAGKSTLLKSICGLVKPQSGKIQFEGKDIAGLPPYEVVKHRISYVPEGGRPFPNMSVLDNLKMGAYTHRENLKMGILEEIYELFPILKKRSNQMAGTLSGGERQMLAIARGLVSKPSLLMLDEPSLGLAPKLVDDIYQKISSLKKIGLTVLLVEQNITYALDLAERGYVLENGHFCMEGDSASLLCSEHIKKHYLGL